MGRAHDLCPLLREVRSPEVANLLLGVSARAAAGNSIQLTASATLLTYPNPPK
ncbi:MAG: hypothetical protein QOK24_2738 [Verrucomicrobiota bacterium]|jgi:hypothetical protein